MVLQRRERYLQRGGIDGDGPGPLRLCPGSKVVVAVNGVDSQPATFAMRPGTIYFGAVNGGALNERVRQR